MSTHTYKLVIIILGIHFHAKGHNVGLKNLLPIMLGHEIEDVVGRFLLRYLLVRPRWEKAKIAERIYLIGGDIPFH